MKTLGVRVHDKDKKYCDKKSEVRAYPLGSPSSFHFSSRLLVSVKFIVFRQMVLIIFPLPLIRKDDRVRVGQRRGAKRACEGNDDAYRVLRRMLKKAIGQMIGISYWTTLEGGRRLQQFAADVAQPSLAKSMRFVIAFAQRKVRCDVESKF